MKRMKKICFSAILTIALICNMVLTTAAAAMPSSEEMYAQRELAGIQQFQRLMDYFESRAATASGDGDITAVYPEYYGGAYLNDDGNLVVVMTDMSDKATVQEVTQNTKLTVQHGAVSLNTLMATYELIWNTYVAYKEMYKGVDESEISPEMKCYLDNFVGVGVKQSENAVLVDLMNTDEKTIACVKQFLPDVEYVRIAEHENILDEQGEFQSANIVNNTSATSLLMSSVVYQPGNPVHIAGEENCTIGFRCKILDDGVYKHGFVTAAHGVGILSGTIVYEGNTSGTNNGVIVGRVYGGQLGGTLDASLVILEDQTTPISDSAINGAIITDIFFTADETLEGTTAYMVGYKSGVLSGKVKSVSYTYEDKETGLILNDLVKCDYKGDFGDSGGVVYAQGANGNYIIGIHRGKPTKLNILQDSVVVKGANILDRWDGIIAGYN